MEAKERSSDIAAQEMISRMAEAGQENAWDRLELQKPQCGFGKQGVCCRICAMGPCRITKKAKAGVCGADADTIVARNFLRAIAAGVAAHSDHGRTVAEVFLAAAKGETPDYQIKDTTKLLKLAQELGVKTGDRTANEIAVDVGKIALAEFGKSEGTQYMAMRAPAPRQELWNKFGCTPRAVDREIAESLHRSTMGVDQDYKNILKHACRVALADGWGGAMLATELQDILFGTPYPGRGEVNMGVLKADEVNIIVHGHEPILSEMIAAASQDEQMLAEAKKVGANGITVAGTCCTANELLMRHGIPIAGNFLNQELVIATGAAEYQPQEYLYGQHGAVKTQVEVEGLLLSGSDEIREWNSVVMIQCVGSRNDENPNCSRVCCQQAIKNAIAIKEINPDANIYVLHRDIRAYGFAEDFYRTAREMGVHFLRYKEDEDPTVEEAGGRIRVTFQDRTLGSEITVHPDQLILSTGVVAGDNEELANILKVPLTPEGFFLEAHVKLRPVDTQNDGIFTCGMAHSPKRIDESISQALAASARACRLLSQDHIEVGGVVARVDPELCAACLICVRACPYEVPLINEDGVSEIDISKCQGCGVCAAECPAKAITLSHFEDVQILAQIDALMEAHQ